MNDMAPPSTRGRKFEQVLDGARKVFMADGFEGASVDTIAKAAGVSKATLYSYFPDKKRLFMEVARCECGRQAEAAAANIDLSNPPAQVLREAARHMLQFFLSGFGQRVFRICVAESDRFPDLGQQFYESGPAVVQSVLVGYFNIAIERGELQIADKELAALGQVHQIGHQIAIHLGRVDEIGHPETLCHRLFVFVQINPNDLIRASQP